MLINLMHQPNTDLSAEPAAMYSWSADQLHFNRTFSAP